MYSVCKMVYFVYSLCKVVDLRLRYNEPNCYAVRLELTCKVGNLLKFKIVLKVPNSALLSCCCLNQRLRCSCKPAL